jgi:hypothetical protein
MRKDYKQNPTSRGMEKRGQVAVFVILALVIISVVIVYLLFPNISPVFSSDVNPHTYLRNCIEPEARGIMSTLSKQGGYSNPTNHVVYQGEMIQYLCYTSQPYQMCVVQQPMIKQHFEREVKDYVEPKARECINDLATHYQRRGYDVDAAPGNLNVTLIPGSLVLDFLSPMTVSKENVQTFRQFSVAIDTEMYDLLMTATSIIQFESALGDSETLLYIQYYPDLRIDKVKRDGNTIYKLSNVVTKDEFTFASRSLVWPEGYGFGELI